MSLVSFTLPFLHVASHPLPSHLSHFPLYSTCVLPVFLGSPVILKSCPGLSVSDMNPVESNLREERISFNLQITVRHRGMPGQELRRDLTQTPVGCCWLACSLRLAFSQLSCATQRLPVQEWLRLQWAGPSISISIKKMPHRQKYPQVNLV